MKDASDMGDIELLEAFDRTPNDDDIHTEMVSRGFLKPADMEEE